MYTYHQSTGELLHNGIHLLACYAGHGIGLNNPAMQDKQDVGPLPVGKYRMISIVDVPHTTGLGTIILEPNPANLMFGRSGFRIHGDNSLHNQTASDGCIIAGHLADRTAIFNSGDHDLEVLI